MSFQRKDAEAAQGCAVCGPKDGKNAKVAKKNDE